MKILTLYPCIRCEICGHLKPRIFLSCPYCEQWEPLRKLRNDLPIFK